jgi:HKD family nuclease
MSFDVFLSEIGGETTEERLSELLSETEAESFFFVSAYVTYSGVSRIKNLLEEYQIENCNAIFGLDGVVTQPSAIEYAIELDWDLRCIESSDPHFHPKFAVAMGSPPDYKIRGGYIGSANFTKGGLSENIEAGIFIRDDSIFSDLKSTVEDIWQVAEPVENVDLEEYSEQYAESSRDQDTGSQPTGVGAAITSEVETEGESDPPERPSYNLEYGTVAWVGLESFTGERRFQPELPRDTAEVVRGMIGSADEEEVEVTVLCPNGETREMLYSWYDDNKMDRLNIPNDVQGVQQAREEESGLAVFRDSYHPEISIELDIIHEEEEIEEIVQRSKREGTWGKTSTRLYGWL